MPAYEYCGCLEPVTSVLGAGRLGDCVQAARRQAAALSTYLEESLETSSPSRRPVPERPPMPCDWPPSLLGRGEISAVTIVAPTEHLKTQWADAAARVGIHIDPRFSNSSARHSHEYDGVAHLCPVASRPSLHRTRTESERTRDPRRDPPRGDNLSWGDAIREAFEPAVRRLALTGTPFRSDTSPIPFVRYEVDRDGIRRSAADYTYGYAEARDGVVRPVLFMAYGGPCAGAAAGDEIAASSGSPSPRTPRPTLAHRLDRRASGSLAVGRSGRQAADRGGAASRTPARWSSPPTRPPPVPTPRS